MILCVTLNPCLDKTLTVPDWEPGANVRATRVDELVGGKGNNVARALARLGRATRPATFLGGAVGHRCATLWQIEGVRDPIVVPTGAATREIVTIRAPRVAATAFFDPDPAITAEEAVALVQRFEATLASGAVQALTLSGSSPSPATNGVYRDLIALAQARQIPVFLDTYGPSLAAIGGFWPTAITCNRREAGMLLGSAEPTDEEVRHLLDRWTRCGVRTAIVTDGGGPALAQVAGEAYEVEPPRIEVVNPIGSGDCLLAGLVDAFLAGSDDEAMLRHAIAAGVANALTWDAGAISPAEVARLEAGVRVSRAAF